MFGRRIYFFKVFTNLTVFLIAKAEYIYHVCVYAKSLQLCLTLCDSMDYSPPGSTVRGILQARILEWVAMPSFRGSSPPRDGTPSLMSPALAGGFFTISATWGFYRSGTQVV